MECTGYWESCSCKECQEVKELYLDRDWFWDNEEMRKEIERLEETKKEFPNDEWLYEPELTELKQQLKEVE